MNHMVFIQLKKKKKKKTKKKKESQSCSCLLTGVELGLYMSFFLAGRTAVLSPQSTLIVLNG